MPGPGAGGLEYSEGMDRVTQGRNGHRPTCKRRASLADAVVRHRGAGGELERALFELYTTLQKQDYGILISADRRRVTVFTFDPKRYDTELGIALEAPLPGLAAGAESEGNTRLVLADGGSRFINDVTPGIPTVTLTRAQLLAGLDHPATMNFGNMVIRPVVSRLTAAPWSGAGLAAEPHRAAPSAISASILPSA